MITALGIPNFSTGEWVEIFLIIGVTLFCLALTVELAVAYAKDRADKRRRRRWL